MNCRRLVVGTIFFFSALFIVPARSADIIWVHQMRGGGDGVNNTAAGDGTIAWEDDPWRQLIEGRGHNIIAHDWYDDLESLSIQ